MEPRAEEIERCCQFLPVGQYVLFSPMFFQQNNPLLVSKGIYHYCFFCFPVDLSKWRVCATIFSEVAVKTPKKNLVNIKIGGKWMFIHPKMEP